MKKALLIFSFIFLMFTFSAFAQDGNDDKQQVPIDKFLEQDAKHNLNVAKTIFQIEKGL